MGAQPDHTIPSQATPCHAKARSGHAIPKLGHAKPRPSHAKLRPLTLTRTWTSTPTRTRTPTPTPTPTLTPTPTPTPADPPGASEVPRWPSLRDISEAGAPTSEAASEIRLASELKYQSALWALGLPMERRNCPWGKGIALVAKGLPQGIRPLDTSRAAAQLLVVAD